MKHEQKFLEFFMNPKSYPYTPEYIQIRQTHISIVSVAPPCVFKVKKEIRLNFLDYSTPEKRYYYLNQELALNRRLCENIYIEVVPLYLSDHGLSFEPVGELFDHALKMNFLNPETNLGYLLGENMFNEKHMGLLIDKLTSFYLNQKSSDLISSHGHPDRIIHKINDNLRELSVFSGSFFSKPVLDATGHYSGLFFQKNIALFQNRYEQGYIKDCHGDLRIEHVHIDNVSAQIYDCIEFNDEFRYIDIVEDFAFLAMELDYFAYHKKSLEFCSKILAKMNDLTGFRLLVFYKLYRALVRAKVNCILSLEAEIPEDKKKEAVVRAKKFSQLAMKYVLFNHEPFVIIIMGKTASGKSTIASHISADIGASVVSTDRIRKSAANIDIYEETPEDLKKGIYSPEFTKKVYKNQLDEAGKQLTENRGVIMDGTFSRKIFREKICAHFAGSRIVFVELIVSDSFAIERLKQREFSRVVSDARLKDRWALDAMYEPATEMPGAFFVTVQNEGLTDSTIMEIYRKLTEINISGIK